MPALRSPIIIGLGYKARQGKNVVVQAMKDKMAIIAPKLVVTAYAFAKELKTYCRDHHDELYEKYPHVGKNEKDDPIYGFVGMLQWYGTDIIRTQDPDHWVKLLEKRIGAEAPDIALVTDVRFKNEAAWLHDKPTGFLVEVIRRREDGTQYLDPKRDPRHASEVDLDGYKGWNYIIIARDGEIEKLKAKASKVLMSIFVDFAVEETRKNDSDALTPNMFSNAIG